MNDVTTTDIIDADIVKESESSFALLMNPQSFAIIQTVSEQLLKSSAAGTFKKNAGDAFAVTLDAMSKGLNPFQVASEAHVTPNGQVGYSAKVVNAVIISKAPIKKRPDYEFFGDWTKILGKVEEKAGSSGGKYYVPKWKPVDEEGLGVRVIVHMRNEDQPRVLEVLLVQCWPRFSTQWATDPQQQICYAAVRKWGRRHAPDVMLGMYSTDELVGDDPQTKHMGAADVVNGPKSALSDAELEAWRTEAKKGFKAAADHWKRMPAECRALATEDQRKEMREIADKADQARTVDNAVEPEKTADAAKRAPKDAPKDVSGAASTGATAAAAPPGGTSAEGNGTSDFVAAMDKAEKDAAKNGNSEGGAE